MKNVLFALSTVFTIAASAQKVKTDMSLMMCTYLPKYVVPAEQQTYSCVTVECEANKQQFSANEQETNWSTATSKVITGFKHVGAGQNPTIAVTIRTEPYAIASKTVSMGQTQGANGAAVISYSYELKAKYLLRAIVVKNGDTVADILRNQGEFTQMNFPNTVKPKASPTAFISAAALEADFNKNNRDLLVVTRKKCNEEYVAFLTDTLNALFGYPGSRMYFELATAKSKSFQYNDLDSAMDYMKAAMDSVTEHTKKDKNHNWSFASSRNLVQKAVVIWEKALTEESTDKKARIHPELAGYIRLNLALGYMMLDNYAKSAELYNKCYNDPELSNGTKKNIDFILKTMYPRFKAGYEVHKSRLE